MAVHPSEPTSHRRFARSIALGFSAVALAGTLAFALSLGLAAATAPARAETTEPARRTERLEVVTAKATTPIEVEIADTEETRARGLMFRTEMAADHGMLFDFRREQPVWFWMKNTYLPLDMIFARADGTVVSVAANTTPLSEATVPSGGAVRFVLELNAGAAARLGLVAGDRLRHPRMTPAP